MNASETLISLISRCFDRFLYPMLYGARITPQLSPNKKGIFTEYVQIFESIQDPTRKKQQATETIILSHLSIVQVFHTAGTTTVQFVQLVKLIELIGASR